MHAEQSRVSADSPLGAERSVAVYNTFAQVLVKLVDYIYFEYRLDQIKSIGSLLTGSAFKNK